MTQENERVYEIETELKSVTSELDELKARHATALEILGEKTERVQEMELDIREMKEIFHQQLQDLMMNKHSQ